VVSGPAGCVVLLRLCSCRVSSFAAWAVESSGRVVRGLGTGMLRCVVRFSSSFPHKLANFPLHNEKAELLPVALKKDKFTCMLGIMQDARRPHCQSNHMYDTIINYMAFLSFVWFDCCFILAGNNIVCRIRFFNCMLYLSSVLPK
jgi:hypothetical protein